MKNESLQTRKEISPKVQLMFAAVMELLNEGADVTNLKISDITQRAGIGKGTAYDYFSSKEELIAAGIMYHVEKFMEDAGTVVSRLSGFEKRINYIFDILESNLKERGCFIRLVHLLMGTSLVAVYMQEAIRSGEAQTPLNFLDDMVKKGIESGELSKEYPIAYMVYTVCTRVLTYATLLDIKEELRPMYNRDVDKKQIRDLMIKGIMQEFGV